MQVLCRLLLLLVVALLFSFASAYGFTYKPQSSIPLGLHCMFLHIWAVMHSFFYSSQDVHRFVVNKVFLIALCGAGSSVDSKRNITVL